MREKKWIALLLALAMILAPMTVFAEGNIWAPIEEKSHEGNVSLEVLKKAFGGKDLGQRDDLKQLLEDNFKKSDEVVLIVEMEESSVIDIANARGVSVDELSDVEAMERAALNSQENLFAELEMRGINYEIVEQYTAVLNAAAIRVKAEDYEKIAELKGIEEIFLNNTYNRPDVETLNSRMTYSHGMIHDKTAWDKGYKGEGSVVAVMDTGADYLHPDFQTLTKPGEAKLNKAEVNRIIREKTLKGQWFSDKMPYGYNYYDRNNDIKDSAPGASMHGMHVAGSVAANGKIKGVAPEAQVLVMKVFGNDPLQSTTMDYVYVKAIDDAVKLGADVVNMSLGSPAGFNNPKSATGKGITKGVENGIVFAISAGNSGTSVGYTRTDVPFNPLNPDIATVGAPSVFKDSTSVASVNNHMEDANYILHNNEKLIAVATEGYVPSDTLKGEYTFVPAGLGKPNEIPDTVRGNIALIQRGEFSFKEKIQNAEAKGAIGVIIYNSAGNAGIQPLGGVNNVNIPSAAISNGDGLKMLANEARGLNKVSFPADTVGRERPDGNMMSSFSSWGPTPTLELKPEISAPGGNIYSTMNDGEYAFMSGTSMAAPHVAGAFAVVNQYIRQNLANFKYNKVTPNTNAGMKEIPNNTYIIGNQAFHENILNGPHADKLYEAMDGSAPVIYKSRGKYFNMYGEIKYVLTTVITYWNANGVSFTIDPNASGGDSTIGSEPLTKGDTTRLAKVLLMNTATHIKEGRDFPVSPRQQGAGMINVGAAITTPAVLLNAVDNEPKVELKNIENTAFEMKLRVVNASNERLQYNVGAVTLRDHIEKDKNSDAIISRTKSAPLVAKIGGDQTVEVPANGFKDFTVTVDFAGNDIYRNMYVEGFVNLTDARDPNANATYPDLTIPFMGFYGNYSEPPIMFQWSLLGEGDTTGALGNRIPFGSWIVGDFATLYMLQDSVGYVTPNPNIERIDAKVVPDYRALRFYHALRRNAQELQYRLLDEQGVKEIGVIDTTIMRRKNYHRSPQIIGPVFDGTLNGQRLEDGRYTYEVRAKASTENAQWQSKRVPIVIDGTGPDIQAEIEAGKLIIEATDAQTTVLMGLVLTNKGESEVFDYRTAGANGRVVGRKTVREEVDLANVLQDGEIVDSVMFFDELGNASLVGVTNGAEEETTQPNIYVNTPGSFDEFGPKHSEIEVSFYVFDTKLRPTSYVNGEEVTDVEWKENVQIKDDNDDILRTGAAYLFKKKLPIASLKPGYNEINIRTVTRNGEHERSIIRPVFVDQSKPVMEVTVLQREETSEKATVSIHLEDDVSPGGALYVNGSEKFIIDEMRFYDEMNGFNVTKELELDLETGMNTFRFRFVDIFGNATETTVQIERK